MARTDETADGAGAAPALALDARSRAAARAPHAKYPPAIQLGELKERGVRMNASEQIDKRIAELDDWRGERIAWLRALIRAADPEIVEEWKWDTPVWSHKGMVCAAGAFKGAVKLNFFKGASLADPDKLFNAGLDAKATRAIDFHQGDAVDEAALTRLVKTAVAHNLRA